MKTFREHLCVTTTLEGNMNQCLYFHLLYQCLEALDSNPHVQRNSQFPAEPQDSMDSSCLVFRSHLFTAGRHQ